MVVAMVIAGTGPPCCHCAMANLRD